MSGIGIAPQESPRRSRRPLLSSCALAAAMVAVGQSPAFLSPASAQSYLGTVLPGSTGATVNNSVPGLTTVTVTAPTAIINWQPNDTSAGTTPIQFQAPGRTTNFESTGSDYTVLNRILPTGAATGRSVLLNGTTNSYIGSSISGGVRGGAVWFYSPDGLILGSSASLNVGSLLLTTRAISDSDFLTGNGVYNFGSADNSRAAITIAGATIDAQYDASLGISSYVAMVAPRVNQNGIVRVDGSAAYVAAEQARITINNGLFGIEVQSGSAVDGSIAGDDVTLNHTGTTSGPASTGAGDPQAIYMVAIPKNLAVTMLVNGNVGYDASSAGVDNGVVVLSAGSNIDSAGIITPGPASGVSANATLVGGTFSSSTTIHARTDARVGGNLTLVGDLAVNAGRNAVVDLQTGRSIIVTGMLDVRTLNTDNSGNYARGTAAIDLATNASLNVSGFTSVDASTLQPDAPRGGIARITAGSGASFTAASLAVRADVANFADNALGGDASVSLTGASLSAGVLTVSAAGNGGADMVGASGTGGTASITVGSSTLNITDGIFVRANGTGGGGFDGGTGGIGTGGTASFTTTGATTNITTQGPISVTAEGYGGGNGTDGIGIGINAGAGRGGTASYSQSGGTVSAGNVLVSATGNGSDGIGSFALAVRGGNGGDGVGGTATFANSGALDVNSVDVVAHGRGGNGGDGFEFGYGTGTGPDGGNGGNAIGGTASFTLTGSVLASSMSLGADARAGSTGNSQFGALGNGGNATGGIANLDLNGGALDIGSPLTISADGNGGYGVTGGFGRGGSVDMLVTSGGTFTSADNSLALSAAGAGGGTPRTATGEVGGAGTGGTVALTVTGSDLIVSGDFELDALGRGGSSAGTGGAAAGGNVTVNVDGGGTLNVAGNLMMNAGANNREGTDYGDGLTGGAASGGSITLTLAGDASLSANQMEADVDAIGGGGAYSGTGGAGTGGTIGIDIAANSTGSVINLGSALRLSAAGRGGGIGFASFSGTGNGGSGGNGTGGGITMRTGSGTVAIGGSVSIIASGSGGRTTDFGGGVIGNAGSGTGGNALLDTGAAAWTLDDLSIDVSGYGGFAGESGYGIGGDGGAGTGGIARLAIGTGSLNANSVFIDASGFAGNGGDGGIDALLGTVAAGKGGDATGGFAGVTIGGGALISNSTNVYADADGGRGGNFFGDGPAGAGGNAFAGGHGGTTGGATIAITGGSLASPDVTVSANGSGGGGGFTGGSQYNGPAANGGNATGGRASIMLAGGGSITAATARIDAGAFGGDAAGSSFGGVVGKAGSATGGTAELTLDASDAIFDDLTVTAFANGGGYSFVETGNAQGGTARIATVGGSLAINQSLLLTGGAQSRAGSGPSPSVVGGAAAFEAAGGTTIDFGPGTLVVDAAATLLPDDGGFGFSNFALTPLPASPGTVIGGDASLVLNGVTLNLAGDLQLNGNTNSIVPGTSAQGGSATLTVRNGGVLTVAGTTMLNANGIAADGDIGGTGQGGTVTLRADGGAINAAQIILEANGTAGASFSGPGGAAAGGDILVDIRSATGQPGSIVTDILTATAIGTGGSSIGSAPGAGGNATGGTITLAGNGAATPANGLTLRAYGQGGIPSSGGASGTGTGGDILFDDGSVDTAGPVTLVAGGGITLQAGALIRSGTNAVLTAGGAIQVLGGSSVQSDGAVTLTAGSGAGGDILFNDSSVDAAGPVTLVAGGGITLQAGALVRSGTNAALTAGGAIQVLGGSAVQSDGAVTFTAGSGAGGDILFDGGSVDAAGAVTLVAGGGITLQAGALVRSGTNAALTAGGAIQVLGGSAVQSDGAVTLTAGSGAGGDILLDGGSVDAAGAATLFAGNDIRLLAGSAVRSNSGVSFYAGRDVLVGGAVALANAPVNGSIQIIAANTIRVDTASGSITATDQAGGLAGRLVMDADKIFVGTQQAWADIADLTNVDAIDLRLGRNDGILNPQGFLRANAIDFRVRTGLYIQNSGTNLRPSGQRAGFTVGAGGATIVNLNSTGAPIQIVINGRQALSDGTFATGKDLIPLLTILGSGGGSSGGPNSGSGSPGANVSVVFDPRSTVNGCVITGDSCRSDTPPSVGLPQQDVIASLGDGDEDFDGETGLVRSLNTPIIQFAELTGLSTEPMIEQPVTGAGNEGLWLDSGGQDTAGDIRDQVTGTRKDDADEAGQTDNSVNQQVTGTRNENLDEPVTGTRNENLDQPVEPKLQ